MFHHNSIFTRCCDAKVSIFQKAGKKGAQLPTFGDGLHEKVLRVHRTSADNVPSPKSAYNLCFRVCGGAVASQPAARLLMQAANLPCTLPIDGPTPQHLHSQSTLYLTLSSHAAAIQCVYSVNLYTRAHTEYTHECGAHGTSRRTYRAQYRSTDLKTP